MAAHKSVLSPLKVASARLADDEVNLSPQAWGRRVARLVGATFGVEMVADRSKNEGTLGQKRIVIKCAKSATPPIFITTEMLQRADEIWGVFLEFGQGAQIWSCSVEFVRANAYFTRGPQTRRAEITLKAMKRGGTLVGTLSQEQIEACHIP
jgi:hypothetical protein